MNHPPILLGTSSFTAAGWAGSFYPKGMRSSDYLSFYAEHFHTVEVDSTFYACPSAGMVSNWAARTREDFIFSIKVPQTITHEKVLTDCDAEFDEFVKTMDTADAAPSADSTSPFSTRPLCCVEPIFRQAIGLKLKLYGQRICCASIDFPGLLHLGFNTKQFLDVVTNFVCKDIRLCKLTRCTESSVCVSSALVLAIGSSPGAACKSHTFHLGSSL